MKGPARQRGIALLVALLAVALAVVLVAGLLDGGELALARTRNALREGQAVAYAQGLEAWAADALLHDEPQSDANTDVWAVPLPSQPVPGGTIGATMRDLDGCFNLNNLAPGAPPAWHDVFRRLLGVLHADPRLDDAVSAWLAAKPGSGSAADAWYLAQPIPYRPSGRVFAHASELRLVRGVSGDAYARIAPYVCALPTGTHINVNTASVPVLEAITVPPIEPALAQRLWQDGGAQWPDLPTFARAAGLPPTAVPSDLFSVRSSYFLARALVTLDGIPFVFTSVIERGNGGIHVLARSRGVDSAIAAGEDAGAPP